MKDIINFKAFDFMPKTIDFEVEETPIFDIEGNVINNYIAIARNDNGSILNVSSRKYRALSNAEFEDLTNLFAEIAGSKLLGFEILKEGRQINAYLSSEDSFRVGEKVKNFSILTNTHDGSSCFKGGIGELIPRCNNGMSIYTEQNNVRIKHTESIAERARFLPMYFKHIEQQRETFDKYCERLATERMSIQQRQQALQELFNITQARELLPARTQNRLELVEQSLDREMRHYGNNAYGFLQGITHYTSNVMQTRERQLIPTTNAAAELNNRAFNYLISNFINN
jgi:hypothetical protein